ncbi:hypothetical protein BATDEDRAFT_28160 [Batrachochytrium dendrobatidis JAM81]|uniref:BZIP domain-containing protein n=2 Tax=Batrachochytrium dendrobatidis TaxID=109871 RepID=F4PD59_BATDJ|nr:uncharacterized protein BATDEDRAFT_28160 [Batrachochytrium dendrobatidis JAM81]EGF77035.1 hypothetical protein BATDEDRAFT_28160 [Batrachochytrium dendrobatidis JAM81]OAJ45125.1 hypothetical protein BDEG_28286 [Batrachochytrium dendrobatidis JEL423]|eukprot:XP_006682423.1 hypothetical protein BATDEDRAFT_28160 [Batrachochytrium dendrobatidis JAM81]
MKLTVVVLSSILAVCSVTIADPVNPTATTSTQSSSAALPSATTGTYPDPWMAPNAQVTNSVDFSRLPESTIDLIQEYARVKESYEQTYGMYESLKLEKIDQEQWTKLLYKKLKYSSRKVRKVRKDKYGLMYKKELKEFRELKLEIETQNGILFELQKKCMDFGSKYFELRWKFAKIQVLLVECLYGKHINYESISYYLDYVESNPEFMKLVDTLRSSVPNQQSGSVQASTSGIQDSQLYESLSSSSDDEMEFLDETYSP